MSLPPDRRSSWLSASPYLDTALDLPPEERVRFIEGLRARSPDLAAHLDAWLAQCEALESEGFLDDTVGAAPPERLAGMRVGPYELLTPIGHGGMGSVWRGRRVDGRYDADVAVKLLNVSLVGRGGETRFSQEGRIIASFRRPYMTPGEMERVTIQAESLAKVSGRQLTLSIEDVEAGG